MSSAQVGWPRALPFLVTNQITLSELQPMFKTTDSPAVILCVDDNESILKLTQLALELEGYTVLTASNGPAALEQFGAQHVDAVVLDYEMPGMNGTEVAHEMLGLDPQVPKVLFTGCPDIPAEATAEFDAICSKPTGLRELKGKLRMLLHNSVSAPRQALTVRTHAAIARLGLDWQVAQPQLATR